MKDSPCHNCPRREVGCHSSCEDYKAWQDTNAAERAARWVYYAGQQDADAHTKETISKSLKRLPTRRKVGQR